MEEQKLLRFLKKNRSIIGLLLLFSMVLIITLLWSSSSQESGKKVIVSVVDESNERLNVTEEDKRTEPRDEKYIDLSVKKENLYIDEPGDYVLGGEFNNTIYIDVEDKIVHLYLDNVTIDAEEGAGIFVSSAAKVVITLMKDSVNYLVDAPARIDNIEEKATIMSVSDITINGEGQLVLTGYYGDGIRTKDVLKILDAEIRLQSKGDGLRGNDGILLDSKSIQIESEKNGIYTSDSGKAGKGTVKVERGNVSIIAGEYGILSHGNLVLTECLVSGKGIRGLYYCKGQYFIEEGCVKDE